MFWSRTRRSATSGEASPRGRNTMAHKQGPPGPAALFSQDKARHGPKIRAMPKIVLAFFLNLRYNKDTRQNEAGYRVFAPPCNPMQETNPPNTTALLRQPSLYRKCRRLSRAVFRGLCLSVAVWGSYILRRFRLPWRKRPTGAGMVPPPGYAPSGNPKI